MQIIVIGAGRGSRLMPTTADTPKCYAEVDGCRILDWGLRAFRENSTESIGREQVCFVGGYQIEKVQRDYPEFTFRHNQDWENNNILLSLFHAEDMMDEGFVCLYSDILFSSTIVGDLLAATSDIALAVDTEWLTRYENRTDHPPDDAEKVTVEGGQVTSVSREIQESLAYGEFIGVARFSPDGAAQLKEHFHRCRELYAGRPWGGDRLFEKAYMIQLFDEMLSQGVSMSHVDTPGGYIEIDTQQDFQYARDYWARRHCDR